MDPADTNLRSATVKEMVEFLERRGSYQPTYLERGRPRKGAFPDSEVDDPTHTCRGIDGEIGNDPEADHR